VGPHARSRRGHTGLNRRDLGFAFISSARENRRLEHRMDQAIDRMTRPGAKPCRLTHHEQAGTMWRFQLRGAERVLDENSGSAPLVCPEPRRRGLAAPPDLCLKFCGQSPILGRIRVSVFSRDGFHFRAELVRGISDCSSTPSQSRRQAVIVEAASRRFDQRGETPR